MNSYPLATAVLTISWIIPSVKFTIMLNIKNFFLEILVDTLSSYNV